MSPAVRPGCTSTTSRRPPCTGTPPTNRTRMRSPRDGGRVPTLAPRTGTATSGTTTTSGSATQRSRRVRTRHGSGVPTDSTRPHGSHGGASRPPPRWCTSRRVRNYPDALAAGAAAVAQGGPLLLVDPGYVPDVTLAELRRLSPASIVLVGGTRRGLLPGGVGPGSGGEGRPDRGNRSVRHRSTHRRPRVRHLGDGVYRHGHGLPRRAVRQRGGRSQTRAGPAGEREPSGCRRDRRSSSCAGWV